MRRWGVATRGLLGSGGRGGKGWRKALSSWRFLPRTPSGDQFRGLFIVHFEWIAFHSRLGAAFAKTPNAVLPTQAVGPCRPFGPGFCACTSEAARPQQFPWGSRGNTAERGSGGVSVSSPRSLKGTQGDTGANWFCRVPERRAARTRLQLNGEAKVPQSDCPVPDRHLPKADGLPPAIGAVGQGSRS